MHKEAHKHHEILREIQNEIEGVFEGKTMLTVGDITTALECDSRVVMNWTKRLDPKRRPPRLLIGKELRFPTKAFCAWLSQEQVAR